MDTLTRLAVLKRIANLRTTRLRDKNDTIPLPRTEEEFKRFYHIFQIHSSYMALKYLIIFLERRSDFYLEKELVEYGLFIQKRMKALAIALRSIEYNPKDGIDITSVKPSRNLWNDINQTASEQFDSLQSELYHVSHISKRVLEKQYQYLEFLPTKPVKPHNCIVRIDKITPAVYELYKYLMMSYNYRYYIQSKISLLNVHYNTQPEKPFHMHDFIELKQDIRTFQDRTEVLVDFIYDGWWKRKKNKFCKLIKPELPWRDMI